MNIFNKICDAFIVDAFKNAFQEAAVKQAYLCRMSKDCDSLHKYMLHCRWNVTGRAC